MEKNVEDIKSKFQDQSVSELPVELWHLIIEYCSIEDLLQLQFINNFFRSNVGDLLRKHIATFQTEIESHIKGNKQSLIITNHGTHFILRFARDAQIVRAQRSCRV